MHTVQLMLESYFREFHSYPSSVLDLEEVARRSPNSYWKEFYNPYTSTTGYFESVTDFRYIPFDQKIENENIVDILGIKMIITHHHSLSSLSGLVVYAPVSTQKYYIYGLDKVGKLIKDKGQVFSLSNS